MWVCRLIIVFFGITLLLASCGNQVALTGGPRDEEPPALDLEKSDSNYITDFTIRDITLYFDEYINLKDAANQIVISPPLTYPPKIASRLQKLTLAFNEEEVLKEDATYIINFGKSIADFTESNELLNFSYVFSTGDYIDSLAMTGQVSDAESGEPVQDALVLLYVDHQDSIIFKDRPFYFARTSEDGTYRIQNLRADTFKVMALLDNNLDYLFDPSVESVGFIDSLVVLEDTLLSGIDLEIFKEAGASQYKSYDVLAQGKARIEFTGLFDEETFHVVDSTDHLITYEPDDAFITLWYRPRNKRSVMYEAMRQRGLDTINMRINPRSLDTLDQVKISKTSISDQSGLHPDLPLLLTLDRPVITVDTSLISISDTSDNLVVLGEVTISVEDPLDISISSDWVEGKELEMTLLPGAVVDFYGVSNDTLIRSFTIGSSLDFGSVEVSLTETRDSNYVITLFKKDKKLDKAIWSSTTDVAILFDKLEPGEYQLEIIIDDIPNGRWDPGNYLEGRQSEDKYIITLPPLRADWVHEEIIDISTLVENVKPSPQLSGDEDINIRSGIKNR